MQGPHPAALRRAASWFAAAGLAVLAAGCGGGGGASAPSEPAQATNESAIATARADQLLGYVKTMLAARGPRSTVGGEAADGPLWLTASVATTSGTVALGGAGTGTVVQEAGVDEDDLFKTDGDLLYALQALPRSSERDTRFARLSVHGRQPDGRAVLRQALELDLPAPAWTALRGLQLDPQNHYAAVIAESAFGGFLPVDCPPGAACITALLPYQPTVARVHLQLLDLGRAAGLLRPERPVQRLEIDGLLVGTRRVGSTLVLALNHTPRLAFDQLPATATAAQRQAALDALTLRDVLPTIRIDGGPAVPLVGDNDCWLQTGNASLQMAVSTLVTIDLATPGYPRTSRCFVGGTEAMYMATETIYLATTRSPVQTLDNRPVFAPDFRTDIHKFAIAGSRIDYRGSGSVAGHLGWDRERSPYRLSEHRGDLRVLTFTGQVGWVTEADAQRVAPSPATLTVLRERAADASLQPVATLPNARRPAPIGKPGEQVHAVRFAGDRGYVVTFLRIDPLYVLDLADPADPRTAGELEVTGFSDQLYPLDGGLLFGVGRDADERGVATGIKVGLFDVRDPTRPRQLDSRVHGAMGSVSALDFTSHGLSLDTVNGHARIALPMALLNGGPSLPVMRLQRYDIDLAAGTLSLRPIELGNGWADLGAMRTLQLGGQLYQLDNGAIANWPW